MYPHSFRTLCNNDVDPELKSRCFQAVAKWTINCLKINQSIIFLITDDPVFCISSFGIIGFFEFFFLENRDHASDLLCPFHQNQIIIQNDCCFVGCDATQTWIYHLSFISIGSQTVHLFRPLLQLSCYLLTQLSTQLQLVSLAASSTLQLPCTLSCQLQAVSWAVIGLLSACPPTCQLNCVCSAWHWFIGLVAICVMCQLSCCMWAQVQIVSSAATFYHLHFVDSQANKVCPISSGVSHLCCCHCNLGPSATQPHPVAQV